MNDNSYNKKDIELKQKQSNPLPIKEIMSKRRIQDWYEYWGGDVFVSFSGGKDSTVLLHLVRSIYPDVQAVFADTGLEYPEIRDFVKTIENVIWVKPKMTFKKVLDVYGYPAISKEQAKMIEYCQNPTEKNKTSRNRAITGYNAKGEKKHTFVISKKWQYLVDSEIKISHRCCDFIKKQPLHDYVKENKRYPYVGTMASESSMRKIAYNAQGCNTISGMKSSSKPLSFWMENDIWDYIKKYDIEYSKIYDMGYSRTGCMFCMFGVHLEKGLNRFQKMKKTHPKQWRYCIEKLGIGEVLDKINVKYETDDELF